ncbi:UNVERIFIED_CONTAM: hypothetical protein NCL1_32875 [Trichonephila clavipes]
MARYALGIHSNTSSRDVEEGKRIIANINQMRGPATLTCQGFITTLPVTAARTSFMEGVKATRTDSRLKKLVN